MGSKKDRDTCQEMGATFFSPGQQSWGPLYHAYLSALKDIAYISYERKINHVSLFTLDTRKLSVPIYGILHGAFKSPNMPFIFSFCLAFILLPSLSFHLNLITA